MKRPRFVSKPFFVGGLWGVVMYTYLFLRINASESFEDFFVLENLWRYVDGLIASSTTTSTLSQYYSNKNPEPDIKL